MNQETKKPDCTFDQKEYDEMLKKFGIEKEETSDIYYDDEEPRYIALSPTLCCDKKN